MTSPPVIWQFYLKHIAKVIVLALAVTACKVSGPRIEGSSLNHYIEQSPLFSHAHMGLMVYDPEKDRILFNRNDDDLFTPASNTKLWTVFAGMTILGDSIPAMKYCRSGEKLYIRGMADPTFLHPEFRTQPVADWLEAMGDSIHISTQARAVSRFGPGWAWDDYPYYYQPEKSALPLYGNVVHVTKEARSESVDIYPEYFKPVFDVHSDSSLRSDELWREEWTNHFQMQRAGNDKRIEEVIPYITSDSLTAILLQKALDIPVSLETKNMDHCQWNLLYSQPTDSLYKRILQESDNFMAEQLLLMCALALSDTLDADSAIEYVISNYFPHLKDVIHWKDGSGLSRYNQFTPRSMIDLLTKFYQSTGIDRLMGFLPAGGRSGTLRNSFVASKPYIFAKTGSMSYVYNLSGFLLTDSGKILIFSFMNNHFNVPFDVLKSEMNTVLTKFKEKY